MKSMVIFVHLASSCTKVAGQNLKEVGITTLPKEMHARPSFAKQGKEIYTTIQ
jgi:hypothetical protein